MDFAAKRQPDTDRQFNRLFIEDGKCARLTCANRTDIAIRFRVDRVDNFTATKHFRFCEQFSVDFESDDGFVFHMPVFSSLTSYLWVAQRSRSACSVISRPSIASFAKSTSF